MLLRATLAYLPAQVLGPLAQFLAAIVWTHYLAPAALGAYAIVWAVQELALLVALSWWSAFTVRYLGDHATPEKRAHFDRVELLVYVGTALAQSAIAVTVLMVALETRPTPELLAATIAFTLTRNLTTHVGDRARASFHALSYNILIIAGPVGGLVLGLFAVINVAPTAEVLLWSYALAQAIGLAIALPLSGPRALLPAARRDLLASAFAYGAPIVLGNALGWIGTHGIRFIVEYQAGSAAVGLVTVGWWLGLRATTFAGLLVTAAAFSVAVERLRKEGAAAARDVMASNGALLLAVLAPATIGSMLLSGPLVELLVAAPYREVTAQILPLALAAGALRVFRTHATDQSFLLFERPVYEIWISTLDAVSTLVLAYVGYRLAGLTGAVVGCTIAAALTAVVSLVMARAAFSYALRLVDVTRIAVGLAAMSIVIMALRLESTRLGLAVEIVLSGAAYVVVLAAIHPIARAWIASRIARLAPA
jgi:O-antigen/teichoic acid export membrane protein